MDMEEWDEQNIDPIIFSWPELNSRSFGSDWELKLVESESSCSYSRTKTLLGPVELENMSSFDLKGLSNLFKDE